MATGTGKLGRSLVNFLRLCWPVAQKCHDAWQTELVPWDTCSHCIAGLPSPRAVVLFHLYSLECLCPGINKWPHFTSALTSEVATRFLLLFCLQMSFMIFEGSFSPEYPQWVPLSDRTFVPSTLLGACIPFSLQISSPAQLRHVHKLERSYNC